MSLQSPAAEGLSVQNVAVGIGVQFIVVFSYSQTLKNIYSGYALNLVLLHGHTWFIAMEC